MPAIVGATSGRGLVMPVVDDTLVADQARPVEIRLVTADPERSCHFWVGLAARGNNPPTKLMDVTDVGTLFYDAATKGINEPGPLMLSDTSVNPPRFVYLMPAPAPDFRSQTLWVDEMMVTLTSWAPAAAGFYVAPEILAGPHAHELLRLALTRLIAAGKTNEIFLLVGSYGVNALLNVALKLKAEVDSDELRVFVFH